MTPEAEAALRASLATQGHTTHHAEPIGAIGVGQAVYWKAYTGTNLLPQPLVNCDTITLATLSQIAIEEALRGDTDPARDDP